LVRKGDFRLKKRVFIRFLGQLLVDTPRPLSHTGEKPLIMRTPARFLAAAVAATLGLGLLSTTAQANDSTTVKHQGVTAKLTVHDIKNKLGTMSDKHWVTLTVKTPAAAHDVADGIDFGVKSVSWYALITVTGAKSCNGSAAVPTKAGSGSYTIPFKVKSKRSTSTTIGTYVTSGACKVSAKVSAYRYASNPALDVDTDFTVKATGYIRSAVKVTTPHRSATSVKKNHTVTLSGSATYQKASPTVSYKYKPLAKGTKVTIQFRAKGSKTWKSVKTVKVTGSKGHWSAKVKVTKTGSYRAVVKATSKLQTKASSSVVVKKK